MWPFFNIETASKEVNTFPRYKELFALLDDFQITSPRNVKKNTIWRLGEVKDYSHNPLGRSFLSEVIKESFVYLHKKQSNNEISINPEVRLIASSKNQDAINTSALLSDNSVTVFEGEVRSYIRDIMYPPRASISEDYIRDMLRCRPYLENESMILIPSAIWQDDGTYFNEKDQSSKLLFDFTSTQMNKSSIFINSNQSNKEKDYVSIPILQVGLPILKNCPPHLMVKIMQDEEDALKRFRYITKQFSDKADKKQLTLSDIQDLFQSIDYEVSRLDIQYKKLLRKRQQSLGTILLTTVGLWLFATIPKEYAEVAKAFFGTVTL
ncbi:hypothetical protein [Halarcobacter sp.]|uniref:hypothetical protein n=1 Tax=Halarcobacter sp. TaxID=2321133 RepID=UPI002AAB8711|nr:hypothetical protein [Halarcobacter sp.]